MHQCGSGVGLREALSHTFHNFSTFEDNLEYIHTYIYIYLCGHETNILLMGIVEHQQAYKRPKAIP